jgi:hypothetical protein
MRNGILPWRVAKLFLLIASLSCIAACANLAVTRIWHEQFTTTSLVMKVEVANVGQGAAPPSTTVLELRNTLSDPYIGCQRRSKIAHLWRVKIAHSPPVVRPAQPPSWAPPAPRGEELSTPRCGDASGRSCPEC